MCVKQDNYDSRTPEQTEDPGGTEGINHSLVEDKIALVPWDNDRYCLKNLVLYGLGEIKLHTLGKKMKARTLRSKPFGEPLKL